MDSTIIPHTLNAIGEAVRASDSSQGKVRALAELLESIPPAMVLQFEADIEAPTMAAVLLRAERTLTGVAEEVHELRLALIHRTAVVKAESARAGSI